MHYDFKMKESTIGITEFFKTLGVSMDDKRKLSTHAKEQQKKAYAKCKALR